MDRIVPSAELIGAARDYLFLLNRDIRKSIHRACGESVSPGRNGKDHALQGYMFRIERLCTRAKRAALTAGQTLYIDG
jgi:hypothetical protein